MKKPGIFITGTDTDVGKTVVAAGLALVLRSRGIRVGVMKPITTGCLNFGKRLVSADAAFLMEAAENEWTGFSSPARYKHPVAPNVAAELEKREIDLDQIRKAYAELEKHYDFIIVEGIGGLMVPIHPKYYVTDLIREFKLPIVVVSKPGLGTINHTLLTIDAARIRGLEIKGIIFNRVPRANLSISEMSNPKVISELSHLPILGSLPDIEDMDVERGKFGSLREMFQERIRIDSLIQDLQAK
ncbi:MAG TPA: dethiobiotin synthase [Candidatus Omnitrophota bacterium]|nr:dethiobiotin synthase [Candidatus Omnitrophota bacterium]